MDPDLLERFERLLHRWAGQWFPESRRGELGRALRRAAERAGHGSDLAGFVAVLDAEPSAALKDLVVQEVLVNETYFFRDAALWEGIEKEVLLDLVQRRGATKNLRIWSAGCSTGEEPYSLAMLLRACIPRLDDWTVHLLATDLSDAALERARMAVYGKRALRELDRERWASWFETQGPTVRVVESVRRLVHFRRHNLIANDYPGPLTNRMDVILCRNVLIYLDRQAVARSIQKFAECLRPAGWLILAPTEVPLEPPPGMLLTQLKSGPMVLRREGDGAAAPARPRLRTESGSRPAAPARPAPSTPPPPPLPLVKAPPPSPLPPPVPATLLQEARQAADRGDLAVALARATACVEAAPVAPAGWVLLGTVQEELGLVDDALESLRRALYLDSGLAVAYLQLARVQLAKGDPGTLRSLANFRKIVELAPPSEPLPEGHGLTVGEGRRLAEGLERSWLRSGAAR